MLLIHIFYTSIFVTKHHIRWKRKKIFEVTVAFYTSFSVAGRQVIIGEKLPITYRHLHSVTRERYLELNKIEKEFLTRNNYPDINDDQWMNLLSDSEWNDFHINWTWWDYSYWNQGNMIELCFDAQSMLHDEWCMLGLNKNIN